jgi:hypothetical protein
VRGPKIYRREIRVPESLTGSCPFHYVRTATLVEPRVTFPPSLNRTKIRFVAGSKGTVPLPCTKTANVGVAFELIVVVTVTAEEVKQAPVARASSSRLR